MRTKENSYRGSLQIAEFVLKNDFFEYNNQIKNQISGLLVGNNCVPISHYIFMDRMEKKLLDTQRDKTFCWVSYVDDMFFTWTHGLEKVKYF